METDDWKKFILDWSQKVANQNFDDYASDLRECDPEFGYGSAGASEEMIKAAEARLNIALPPSYRQFLKATNGLKQPFLEMAATGGDYCAIENVEWFRTNYDDWIEAWSEADEDEVPDEDYFVYGPEQEGYNLRTKYLKTALAISEDGDAGIYLLIPEVQDKNGEWEAWHFASWIPGAHRYRSFEEMMKEHRKRLENKGAQTTRFGF